MARGTYSQLATVSKLINHTTTKKKAIYDRLLTPRLSVAAASASFASSIIAFTTFVMLISARVGDADLCVSVRNDTHCTGTPNLKLYLSINRTSKSIYYTR